MRVTYIYMYCTVNNKGNLLNKSEFILRRRRRINGPATTTKW